MKRTNLFELYRFGKRMGFVERLMPQLTYEDIRTDCLTATLWLEWILKHDHIPIVDSRSEAERLLRYCNEVVFDGLKKHDEQIGPSQCERFKTTYARFEILLSAELARQNVYTLTAIAAYDTDKLLSSGTICLTETTVKKMSENAVKGFTEATRCLALKLPTAAGFHFLRSVEEVTRQYYDVLSSGAPRPQRESMGKYIAELENLSAIDPRMLEVLKSIKNLRRNPIAHPEHFLEMEDALITFDVAKSAISTMIQLVREHEAPKAKP